MCQVNLSPTSQFKILRNAVTISNTPTRTKTDSWANKVARPPWRRLRPQPSQFPQPTCSLKPLALSRTSGLGKLTGLNQPRSQSLCVTSINKTLSPHLLKHQHIKRKGENFPTFPFPWAAFPFPPLCSLYPLNTLPPSQTEPISAIWRIIMQLSHSRTLNKRNTHIHVLYSFSHRQSFH